MPYDQAVDAAINSYNMLRRAYPGKRVVIAEFGWPSAGYNRGGAMPGRAEQAIIIRDFVTRAQALGIDYNIIEAFDQPWKTMEGSVGQYWGLFDASRQPKFQWYGPIVDTDHWKLAAIAVAAGFLLSLPILTIVGATLGQALLLAFAAHAVGAWAATVFHYWASHYFVPGSAFALGLGVVLLVPLVLIALARVQEIAAILFGPPPQRLLPAQLPAADGYAPKVSIHVPAHMEPPEMLKATLDAIAGLDYPNFECVVVINNTPDPAYWRPIEDHCRALGERFKFVNVDGLAGFKAGALRLALGAQRPDDRDHRRGGRRLCGTAGMAQGPRPGVCGSQSRPDPGAAGSPRRRQDPDASGNVRRICRVLRHRDGPAQRGQRHHRPRHHVPDPQERARERRRLVERHHLRGYRSWPDPARAGLARPLHRPALWLRAPAR